MSLRYGMVIDLERCIGCYACTIACKMENGISQGSWIRVDTMGGQQIDTAKGEYPNLSMLYLPRLCMHCQDAPCVEVCPTGACYKREDGIVLVDYDKCVGCKYCIVACPYTTRYHNKEGSGYFAAEPTPDEKLGYQQHKLGAAEKCTFCMHRVERGEEPACVEACPTSARHFGNLDDPQSEVSRLITSKYGAPLLKDLGTKPSVYYLPPRRKQL